AAELGPRPTMSASEAICATSAIWRTRSRTEASRSRPASSISGAGLQASRSVGRSFGTFGSFESFGSFAVRIVRNVDSFGVLDGPGGLRFQPPDLFPLSSIGLEGHTSVQRE